MSALANAMAKPTSAPPPANLEDDGSAEPHLAGLDSQFIAAMDARNSGRTDQAVELFTKILVREPRLAEPRIELGAMRLEMGQIDEAEEQAREAVRILENGGQWTEDVPENVLHAMAWALLGSVLKERAASDEVVFGDPAHFRDLLEQSRVAFAKAAELDPEDSASKINADELASKDDDGSPEDDA